MMLVGAPDDLDIRKLAQGYSRRLGVGEEVPRGLAASPFGAHGALRRGGRLGRAHALQGHEHLLELLDIAAQLPGIADVHRVPLPAFDGGGEVHAANGGFDHLLDVFDRKAVPAASSRFTSISRK